MRYEKGTFSVTPNKEVMRGKPTELQVIHFWLCDRADDEGICFPSRPKISSDTGIKSLRTIDKYIQQLIDMGILVKTKRKQEDSKGNKSNLYQIIVQEMHDTEQELHDVSANNALGGSATDSTITIPIINNTQITILDTTKVVSQPIQEEVKMTLPVRYGNTPLLRIMYVYKKLWYKKFGTTVQLNFGKFGAIVKRLLSENTEYQIAILLFTYFNWYGGTGKDEKEYLFLSGKGFPIEMLPSKINIMVAYLTNVIGVEYNSEDSVGKYAVKSLKEVLS